MLIPVLHNIDKSLESDHFKKLILSIQLKLDGFSFSILNDELNKVVAVVDYKFEDVKHPLQLLEKVKLIYQENSLLQMDFTQVKVSHVNSVSTLVPVALFDDDNLRVYLEFNHKLLENEYLTYDIVNSDEIANVYSPFTVVNDFLFEKHGEFTFKHFSSILIENFIEQSSSNQDFKMFVHVQDNQFEIVVVENKKLILYNSYLYETKEDLVYYILFVAEQLKQNPEDFDLELYGSIEPYSEIYALIYKYVRNVYFGKRLEKHQYSHELDGINEHDFFALINQ
ncbi:MAG: DUF3822 family protein [Flavobacteriales bacterium]|nr:DUF3822 family protein [Flavobacteriales bacterium]